MQPDAAPTDAAHYPLGELLRFHDGAFVTHLYLALYKRMPTDAELVVTVDDLRAGRRSKTEIVEALLAQSDRHVHVAGLPSPTWRRVSRWPFVGYVMRIFRGLARLPVLMQHHQQFEAYALGQQQRIVDHINGVIAPSLADAFESVLMFADSLADLSQRQAEAQAQLETHLTKLTKLTEALTAQQRHIDELQHAQRELQQAQQAGQRAQQERQHAQQEEQHAQQVRLDDLQRAQQAATAAQREFLVQEQRVIVETQKVVLEELRAQLRELAATHEQQRVELLAQVRRLQTRSEATEAGTDARESGQS